MGRNRASVMPLVGLALAAAALQLGSGWIEPYGLFHDETYYWACSRRPGLGYVDHPPLAPWILAAGTAVLGNGRLVFELVPALCAAATVLLTGMMARRLGAGLFGELLAAFAAAVMPSMLVLFSFYSVNAFELFFWTATTFLMVELIRTGEERLWPALGVLAGFALLNKHTFVLLWFGLAVGILATPLRAQLRSRRLWIGGALALLLALPNLYWNYAHGWPSLAFYSNRPAADLPATVVQALALQFAAANPAAVLLWLPGALYLLFSRRVRPYRPFGIAFATVFVVILLSGQRRADRIAGIYPVVLAAGATFWDQWRGRGHRAVRWALAIVLLFFGALVLPAALPLLPPQAVAAYFENVLQEKPEIETGDVGQAIPLYLLGRLEWERFAGELFDTLEGLPAQDRERVAVLAPHWVFASVIEYYGRDRDLPPVASPHNAYWFWRQDAAGRDLVVAVGVESAVLSRYFTETRLLHVFRCQHCAIFRPDMPFTLAGPPVRPLAALLSEWRFFGIEGVPALRQ
jgi:4-amino-4-deoxy-L-arabinose transferase-like glycosyltransferase